MAVSGGSPSPVVEEIITASFSLSSQNCGTEKKNCRFSTSKTYILYCMNGSNGCNPGGKMGLSHLGSAITDLKSRHPSTFVIDS